MSSFAICLRSYILSLAFWGALVTLTLFALWLGMGIGIEDMIRVI